MANAFDQFDEKPNAFDQFDEDEGFSATNMVGNIPSDAVQVAKNTANVIMNPIDTLTGLADLGRSGLEKAGRKFEEFYMGEEIAPTPGKEDAADAFGQMLSDDYGSVDAALNTLEERPVQSFMDILGIATGTASLTGAPRVANIINKLDPLNMAVNTARGTGNLITEKLPQRMYQSSAKFSTTIPTPERRAMIQTALDEGLMPTNKGVQKIENRIDILNAQISDMIDGATQQGIDIPVRDIMQFLNDLRSTKGGVRLGAADDLATIDKLVEDLMVQVGDRTHISPQEMQRFKVEAYKDIAWDAKRQTGTPIKEETYKNMARGAKTSLQDNFPDIKEINQGLSALYELQPHLSRSANRIENRNVLGLSGTLGGLGGAVSGGAPGALMGAATMKAMTSPTLQAKVAIALNKMKDKDMKWLNAAENSTEVRLALQLMGRELPGEEPLE